VNEEESLLLGEFSMNYVGMKLAVLREANKDYERK